jgi:DNA-binding LacI/PurR family transcriptional regulator
LRAARSRGRSIPGDLSIVGFDDVEFASYVDPPLTTIAQDQATMGLQAVRALAAQLAGDGDGSTRSEARVIRLPTVLRVRGSSGPPPT